MMNFAQIGALMSNSGGNSYLIDLTGITNIAATGDSITVGQNASPSSNAYINRFQSNNSIATITNYAVGGRGVWNQMNAVKSATWTRSATIMTIMLGLNDMRRGGNNSKTIEKIKGGIRYLISKQFALSQVATGSASITRSGTVSNSSGFFALGGLHNGTTIPSSTTCARLSLVGSYYEYTFTGDNINFSVFGNDNSVNVEDYATFTVEIDGQLIETINTKGIWADGQSDGAYDNARVLRTFQYWLSSGGSHTIKLTITAGTFLVVDHFGILNTPSSVGRVAIFEIPYLNSAGYATSPANGTSSISDQISNEIRTIVDEYISKGYKISYVNTNSFYNLSTGLDTDNIHPNNTGHAQIASAIQARII